MNACTWCNKPVASRRREMSGVAQNYCTNKCMMQHAEDLIRQDPSNMWSAPPGADPNHGYKIPKYNPKVTPPPVGAGVWDYLAWATLEFVEQYRSKNGGAPPPHPFNPFGPSGPPPWGSQYQQQTAPPPQSRPRPAPIPVRPEKEVMLQNLGLAPTASLEEAEKTYKILARKYHPDANGNSGDTDMKRINIAIGRLREIMK